jgi:hypothetical protein
VLGLDSDGKFPNLWRERMFNNPHGLLIITDDIIYCADDKNHRVRKFTLDGKILITLGTKDQPSDTLYIAKD